MIETAARRTSARPADATDERRRLRRTVMLGPRCPDCTGPLVFGEGCSVCPVCGYSGCSATR